MGRSLFSKIALNSLQELFANMPVKIEREDDRIDWEDTRLECRWLAPLTRTHVERKINELLEAGSLPEDWAQMCQEFGDILCERADVMMYPTKKTLEEANKIFAALVDAIAILAFVPGGIRIFGYHYQASFDGCSKT